MCPAARVSSSAKADTRATLVALLRTHAEARGEDTAVTYLGDGETVKAELSYAALDAEARAVAARLQGLGAAGECVVLAHPPGPEFLGAFFGTLYAGAIAVPLPMPRHATGMAQLAGIAADVGARILLATDTALARMRRADASALEPLVCLPTETTDPELAAAWQPVSAGADAIAYLQYTSGSTSNRKGVAIAHGNVISNLLGIAERFGHHEQSVSVNWLPHFHDLGLVGGILQPLYHGQRNVMMSPTAFVQQPVRWLEALTRYRGTYTNSPNYGFDLCVRRVTDAQCETLDLSAVEVMLNGAEPVRRETLEAFVHRFAAAGLRQTALYPAYGLAEATLVVTGGDRHAPPVVIEVAAAALERGRAEAAAGGETRALVGCGTALQDTAVTIVDALDCTVQPDETVGEIWVRGPGVAEGYWADEAATEADFRARLAGDPSRTWLRTGDLGFLRAGELFVTGRLKDLIIVRGANHYPQDIEWTVEQSDAAFRPGCGAAFAVETDGEERLVVAYEIERERLRDVDPVELGRVARKAVAETHELRLHTLVLLKTGTVPRTSSGKIQRRRCREGFLEGALDTVGTATADPSEVHETVASDAPVANADTMHAPGPVGPAAPADAAALVAWLRDYAGERLNSRIIDERRTVTPHVLIDFGNHGVLGLQVPRALGGTGLGHRDALRVIEQLGAIDQTLTMMTIVHNTLGIGPILAHGAPALRETLVPRLASGRELVAFAITEPGAGSNPQGIASTATPDGDGAWRLDGRKLWSGSAGWAHVINVFAHARDETGQLRGMCGFALQRETRGLRIGPEAMTLGMRGMVQNAIDLDGARVTADRLLGKAGAGMAVAQDAMMQGRLHIAAACVGGIKRCLQLLLRFAERRTIATGPMLANPLVLERATRLACAASAVEALVAHVADRLDAGQPVPLEAYVVCKTAGPEWFWRAADDLVQFLGGRGYIETNLAPQLLRDARVARILEGPTESLQMFLGSRVVNEANGFRALVADALGARELEARVQALAHDLVARSTGPDARFDDVVAARRWAYALIGEIATDAVLLAALPADAPAAHQAWATHLFESTVERSLREAARPGEAPSGAALVATVGAYAADIGDVEQSLPGADDSLDRWLMRNADEPSHQSSAFVPASPPVSSELPLQAPIGASPAMAKDIERFVVAWLARELKIPERSVDAARSLFDYGVDSVTLVTLIVDLESALSTEIFPDIAYESPTVRAFAENIAADVQHSGKAQ